MSGHWVGGVLAAGSVALSEQGRKEAMQRQRVYLHEAVTAACRWENEAYAGMLRALATIQALVEDKLLGIEQIVVQALVRSGLAPKVAWKQVAEQHRFETAELVRHVCAAMPAVRDQIARMPIDGETRAAIAA